MGKGGGCVPSKQRAPKGVSDKDPPTPNPERNSTVIISGQSQTQSINTTTTTQVQDGLQFPKKLKIFIVFYSTYGHVEILAKRMKKGVDSIEGVEGFLYRVPETLAPDILEQMRVPPKDNEVPLISVEELVEADGFLFGFPTRYGCMAAQMKAFFDSTGRLWEQQRLAGVPAGFFVSTGTQGGGQETTACDLLPNKRIGITVGFAAPRTSKDWGIMLVIKFCYVPKVYLSYNDIGTALTPNKIHLFTPYATECLSWTAITQLAHHGMLYVPIGYTFGAGMFKMDSIRGGSPYGAGVFSGDGTREPSDTELALAEHQGKYMAGIVKRFAKVS
uniref:NAD(P)H dehydrogenase (quinone) n=1 Tax=Quercus lobata TaxID=97700 RepID=A0A7N2RDM1_QUELO